LVQPPEDPQLVRFYTGTGSTYDQGGHLYEFTWNPGKVTWYTDAAGGENHSYATEDAIFAGLDDYVQCLPADVEIRMNLWNLFGSVTPVGMSDDEVVEVIIDDFYFTPSNLEYVVDGGYCTKPCQCDVSSSCVNGICIPDP
jgi:beta-glucanase (GH16 family)